MGHAAAEICDLYESKEALDSQLGSASQPASRPANIKAFPGLPSPSHQLYSFPAFLSFKLGVDEAQERFPVLKIIAKV